MGKDPFDDPFFSRKDHFDDPFFKRHHDYTSSFGACRGIAPGICQNFHHAVGFNNLWIIYIVVMVISIILCGFYACYMSSKFSDIKYVIKWHVGIFLVNVTVWFWIPTLLLYAVCQVTPLCGFAMAGMMLIGVSSVLVVLDLVFSPEAKYFKNQREAQETTLFLEGMKAAKPEIGVKIACYHWETRMRRNSNSNLNRTTKRVTHRDYRAFPIDSFVDETETPSKINSKITLFTIDKTVNAGNAATDEAFNQFKNRFIAANQFRDQAMDTNVQTSIVGYVDNRVMTVKGEAPWWANKTWFYVLSMLNASVPMRIMFRTGAAHVNIMLVKKYFVDPTIQRTYDFDTGVATGPTVINNIIMPPQQGYGQPAQYPAGSYVQPQQGYGQPQQYPPGSYIPPQPSQPYAGGVQGGYVPVPPQFGQPGFVPQPQPGQAFEMGQPTDEKKPFMYPETKVDDAPPPYNPNY